MGAPPAPTFLTRAILIAVIRAQAESDLHSGFEFWDFERTGREPYFVVGFLLCRVSNNCEFGSARPSLVLLDEIAQSAFLPAEGIIIVLCVGIPRCIGEDYLQAITKI